MEPRSRRRVLFLCTGNACRSQMAEGWARALRAGDFDACSAGVAPKGVDPIAIEVMREAGVDISAHRSKHVDELRGVAFDLVVTVCASADAHCPSFRAADGSNVRILHAGFDDPPGLATGARSPEEARAHYRRVRDEIRDFVRAMP